MNWRRLLLSPHGRIGRKAYWLGLLPLFVISLVAEIAGRTLTGAAPGQPDPISSLVNLLVLYPSLCLGAKRLHDLDRTGWWQLAPFAVLLLALVAGGAGMGVVGTEGIGFYALAGGLALMVFVAMVGLFLIMGFAKGQEGRNRFGEPDSGARDLPGVIEAFS